MKKIGVPVIALADGLGHIHVTDRVHFVTKSESQHANFIASTNSKLWGVGARRQYKQLEGRSIRQCNPMDQLLVADDKYQSIAQLDV